jgi:hypothetical protein
MDQKGEAWFIPWYHNQFQKVYAPSKLLLATIWLAERLKQLIPDR